MFKSQFGAKVDKDTKANRLLHIKRKDEITRLLFKDELMNYAENTFTLDSKRIVICN